MADADAAGGADAFAIEGVSADGAGAGAGGVVFRGVGEDGEFGVEFHGSNEQWMKRAGMLG